MDDPSPPSSSPPPPPPSSSRSYWKRWTKHDFYPESSFRSFSSYKSALAATCPRLTERLLARSTDADELISLPNVSLNPFPKCLTWWDILWLGFSSVVGSGIFVVTGQEARYHAGPAIVISYALSGVSALLSVFCYTEFGVEIPVAGGSFSYLRVELGDLVAFIAAGNIMLEGIVGSAGLARSWSSYCASMLVSDSDFFRLKIDCFAEGFNLLDPVAVLVLLVVNGVALSGTKMSSSLNWVISLVTASVIVFIIVIGFIHGKSENLVPFFPNGAEGVFQAAAVVFWSYTGFDMAANMAEDTKNPSRDIPIGLVGSMSMIILVYCLMCMVLTMMVKYTEIDVNAAYAVAFDQIGMRWAKWLVSICALKGTTTSLLAGSLGQARYTTQIARSHMIPPWFALVHPRTGTPINATLLMTILSAVVAFFSSLDVLSSVLSLSTLFLFMLVAVALLMRRYYVKDGTPRRNFITFLACLAVIIGSSIGLTSLWNKNQRGWIGYTIVGVIWFSGTMVMQCLPKQRVPKIWGVPLVPWLPSLSIAMNLFLIGSLGYVAFLRFIICSLVMLVYYLLVGLHATYDVAHQNHEEETKLVESR